MSKQTKPQAPPPPVDLQPTFNKRGKSFPLPKATWNQEGDPGRGPYSPEIGRQVLHESIGWED